MPSDNTVIQDINIKQGQAFQDPVLVKWILILFTFLFFIVIMILPLVLVFSMALSKGFQFYLKALVEPAALSALRLTLLVSAFVVPINTLFGVVAAWTIIKFEFPGKSILQTVLDLPFAVSPVIAGLIFVLFLGARSPLGSILAANGLKIIFAPPGIIIATVFITFPFVARELIPLMQSLGNDEEEAAILLGASGFKTFWKVTLPNIRWGLLYGIILCNARTIGEFGAVSVVSGHIRGLTNTLPLHVEILYNEYNFTAAFSIASLLVLLALVTLGVKLFVERRYRKEDLFRGIR